MLENQLKIKVEVIYSKRWTQM